jgi:hypothetical protein
MFFERLFRQICRPGMGFSQKCLFTKRTHLEDGEKPMLAGSLVSFGPPKLTKTNPNRSQSNPCPTKSWQIQPNPGKSD